MRAALLVLALFTLGACSAGALDKDAASSIDAGTGGVGAICANAPDGAVAVDCAPGLACCYPCGRAGCASVCSVPCDAGFCVGGCPLLP